MNDKNIIQTKLKQYLFNNLWYGENRRRLPTVPSVAVTLDQPDYSRDWGIDISHWDGVVDLAHAKSMGASFVYIKGIDGTLLTKYFVENYAGAKACGLPQAPYAWLYRDENISAVKQAQATNNLIQKYPPALPVAIDFESTYYGGVEKSPNFSDLRKWVTEFLRLGNPKPILYSAKYFMNQYGQIPEDLKAMFLGLWVANYGTVNPVMPLGWSSWIYHQFSDRGDMAILAPSSLGTKAVDLNYASQSIPQPSEGRLIFPGVLHYEGQSNGWKYFIDILDPTQVRYEIYESPAREIVSDVARRKGAALATNGGEWDRSTSEPKNIPNAPYITFDPLAIDFQKTTLPRITGLRYIIRDGVIAAYLDGPEAQYTEGHSRTLEGLTADGRHIQMMSEGRYPNQGLTLKQGAVIMLQAGAVDAFDSGGGGDSTYYLSGNVLNIPEDQENGIHYERAIPEILLIYPNTGAITMNGTAQEALGKIGTVRNKPSRYGSTMGAVSAHKIIEFTEIVDVIISGSADIAGDKWLKLPDGNFINYILAGATYFTILTQPTNNPPPSLEDVTVVSITKDGVTTTYTTTGKTTVT